MVIFCEALPVTPASGGLQAAMKKARIAGFELTRQVACIGLLTGQSSLATTHENHAGQTHADQGKAQGFRYITRLHDIQGHRADLECAG